MIYHFCIFELLEINAILALALLHVSDTVFRAIRKDSLLVVINYQWSSHSELYDI